MFSFQAHLPSKLPFLFYTDMIERYKVYMYGQIGFFSWNREEQRHSQGVSFPQLPTFPLSQVRIAQKEAWLCHRELWKLKEKGYHGRGAGGARGGHWAYFGSLLGHLCQELYPLRTMDWEKHIWHRMLDPVCSLHIDLSVQLAMYINLWSTSMNLFRDLTRLTVKNLPLNPSRLHRSFPSTCVPSLGI